MKAKPEPTYGSWLQVLPSDTQLDTINNKLDNLETFDCLGDTEKEGGRPAHPVTSDTDYCDTYVLNEFDS